jgi:hypothetical protein
VEEISQVVCLIKLQLKLWSPLGDLVSHRVKPEMMRVTEEKQINPRRNVLVVEANPKDLPIKMTMWLWMERMKKSRHISRRREKLGRDVLVVVLMDGRRVVVDRVHLNIEQLRQETKITRGLVVVEEEVEDYLLSLGVDSSCHRWRL